MSRERPTVRIRGRQRGFTLLEILIALSLGLFVLAALLTIVQTNRAVYGDQSQLAQLQDNERMAMTLMTDVIQSAGYFPTTIPPTITQDTSLTATTGDGYAFPVGQSMYGTYSATVPGDAIYVRYMTASGDGVLNCSGVPNTTGANTLYVNEFYVAGGQLVCNMNGTPYNLVSGVTNSTTTLGVTNLSILYGVKRNAALPGNNVDTYLNASLMTAADWSSVISVMIELTFTNPLYNTNGSTTQPKTVYIQRVVGVMNQLGPVE
jgi:type IV pilus assembly protein PilW